MKKRKWIRGLSITFAFLSALFICAETLATSSSDYKTMIDGIFNVNFATGNSNLDTYAFKSDFENTTELYTRRQEIATALSEEGSVLLKNENGCLPLRRYDDNKELKVTLLGSSVFTYDKNGKLRDNDLVFYGGKTGSRIYKQQVTTKEGRIDLPITMVDALARQNIKVNPSNIDVYSSKNFPSLPSGSEANGQTGGAFSINEPLVNADEFKNNSDYNDAAIVVVSRFSGEGREYFPGTNGVANKSDGSKSALHLTNNERHLIDIAKSISDKVIVLINSAVTMEIEELKNDTNVDSIMWIGLPGSYGLDGVGKIIAGKVSPSGGLSDTFSSDASSSPAAQNFGIEGQQGGKFEWSDSTKSFYTKADNGHYVVLAEGLYTGYYYYETRYNDCLENRGNASSITGKSRYDDTSWKYENNVTYPFGYGLTYTDFDMEILKQESGKNYLYNAKDNTITIDVKVINIGEYPSKKNVQLYVSSPYTQYDIDNGVEKSAIQLVNFGKTKVLNPNESETVTIKADLSYIASYDKTINHDNVTGGYILEDADYYFSIGDDAHDALNQVLVNKDANLESSLYSESSIEKDLAFTWNPAQENDLISSDRGAFNNGINATLLNKNSEGIIIANQLEDGDYNYHKANTVTYLSRNNWSDTFPKAYVSLDRTSSMTKFLGTNENNAGRVYDFKTGSVNTEFGVDYNDMFDEEDPEYGIIKNKVIAEYKGFSYEDEAWETIIKQVTFDEAWMFAPYGGTNCEPLKSVNSPTAWQIDGPNGNVTRVVGNKAPQSGYLSIARDDINFNYLSSDMPCEGIIAATFNQELVEEQGRNFGEDGLWSRNVFQWAPGMNLHRTPFNSRNHEYYSEDPMLTNIIGTNFVRGGLEKGMILSAKHFAFNTQESYREGLSQFMEEQSARELELRGYQGLFKDVNYVNSSNNTINALGIMSSFSRIGVCGVNAHTGLMKNILRGEWLFRGSISTDMVVEGRYFNPQDCVINNVTFMATSNALKLLREFWPDYNNKQNVRNDPYLCEALQENMHHYLYSIANSNLLNGMDANTVFIDTSTLMSPWEYVLISSSIGCGILSIGGLATYIALQYLAKEEETNEN